MQLRFVMRDMKSADGQVGWAEKVLQFNNSINSIMVDRRTGKDVLPGRFIHSDDVIYRIIDNWIDVPLVTITEGEE